MWIFMYGCASVFIEDSIDVIINPCMQTDCEISSWTQR